MNDKTTTPFPENKMPPTPQPVELPNKTGSHLPIPENEREAMDKLSSQLSSSPVLGRQNGMAYVASIVPHACVMPSGSIACFDIIAYADKGMAFSPDVKANGLFATKRDTVVFRCQGHEPASHGYLSGTKFDVATFFNKNCSVKINGHDQISHGDFAYMNVKDTFGIFHLEKIGASGGLSPQQVLDSIHTALGLLKDANTLSVNRILKNPASRNVLRVAEGAAEASKELAAGNPVAASATVVCTGATWQAAGAASAAATEICAPLGIGSLGCAVLAGSFALAFGKATNELCETGTEATLSLPSKMEELSQSVATCTGNNPANASACAQAAGFPPVNHPIPPNMGFH